MTVHEYRCPRCREVYEINPVTDIVPVCYCAPSPVVTRRVWSVGIVWPRSKRGH